MTSEAVAGPEVGPARVPARLAALPMLDGLRAVAALAVLLTHVAFQTGEVAQGAGGAVLARFDVGVAVFFVLSGFLLYRPHAAALRTGGHPPGIRRYALRRAARILPAYWLALAAVVLTAPSAPAGQVVNHGWLGQTYVGSLFPTFTQTWSLCTEVAFYAALPLLAAGVRRIADRRGPAGEWWALAGLAAVGYGYIAVVRGAGLPDRALLWLPGHLDWFAVGMAVAALWARLNLPAGTGIGAVAPANGSAGGPANGPAVAPANGPAGGPANGSAGGPVNGPAGGPANGPDGGPVNGPAGEPAGGPGGELGNASVGAGGGPGGGRLVAAARLLAAWPGTCWAAAAVLLWLVATPIAGPLTLEPIPGAAALVKEAGYAVIGGLLLLPAALGDARSGGLAAALAHPVSRYLGRISYGVFLWHLLVLRGVYGLTGWEPFTGRLGTAAVLTIAGSVAAAAVSWVLVERPALRLAERLANRRQAVGAPSPAG